MIDREYDRWLTGTECRWCLRCDKETPHSLGNCEACADRYCEERDSQEPQGPQDGQSECPF